DGDEFRRGRETFFVKTHDLPLDDSPAVYLVRDGRDALVSYAHFVRTYEPAVAKGRAFDEVLRILIKSRDHFGGWSGNVLAWCERSEAGRTVYIRYEDLVQKPLGLLEGVMRRLGVQLRASGTSPPDFADLHRRWPEFFRRGTTGAWRSEMSEELHRHFWQHHGDTMHWLGYRDREDREC